LEDEHGCTQVIVWRDVRDAYRQVLVGSRLLAVEVHGSARDRCAI
jgi:error-prone DNA polymerase